MPWAIAGNIHVGMGVEDMAAAPDARPWVLARAQRLYPLGEIVTHRFGLQQADAAVRNAMADGAMKVVISAEAG